MNRAKEGLRVCEEIARFILSSSRLTAELKSLRHALDSAVGRLVPKEALLAQRNSRNDVGMNIYGRELRRTGLSSIFGANIQRVKESVRVLEEFSKLADVPSAVRFKKIRYRAYELEKKMARSIASLRGA